MNKIHLLASAFCFIILFSSFTALSQIPRGFNYQAVVRNDEGGIMADTELSIRFTLYRTVFQQSDVVDYRETQNTTSNEYGLVNAVIGQGTPDIGTWTGITWLQFPGFTDRYLRVEMDFGNGWLELSDEMMQAVPFAELADEASSLIGGAWTPEGNFDTDENNFLGTVNYSPLVFKSANTERLRMNEDGEIIFTVNSDQPTVRIQNVSEESFEANLSFSNTFSPNIGRIVYNPFGFGMVNQSGGVTLNNTNVDFTIYPTGNAVLQAANASTDIRLVIRDGIDADIANINSGYLTLGFTNDLNVILDNNEIMARENGAESELYLNGQGGGVVINSLASTTHSLFVNGTAAKPGGGSWTASSDARLKDNVQPYELGLEEVLRVEPVTYHYTSQTGNDTTVEYVGVIAQELQKISPDMVIESELELVDGSKGEYLSVDPSAFTYMLINAIKEQQKQIEELKKEVAALKAE